MSKKIVSQRPFSHKKRRQSFRKMLNRSGISIPEIKISPKLKNILSRGMLFIVIVIVGISLLIKNLFFKPEQKIANVKFSEDTIATYQDIELFNLISDEVKGQNYYILSSNKDELLSKVQKQFPFVGEIQLQLEPQEEIIIQEPDNIIIGIQLPHELPITAYQTTEAPFPLKTSMPEIEKGGTLGVQLLYYDPKVLVKLNGKEFAVRDENTNVELKEGMLLGIREPDEEPLFVIETPMYLSGTTNLDGFFFEVNLTKFLQIIPLAKEAFPNMERFVYLAGSTRIAIFTDDKTLYFNFPNGESIQNQRDLQISKYNTLKEKYPKFNNIRTIDLGALEKNKAIIKNH